MDRHEEALDTFDTALKIDSKNSQALCNKANVLVALGRHDDAIRVYNRALQVEPKDVEILNNIGIVYAGQKKHKKAIKFLNLHLMCKKMILIHCVILVILF